MDTQGGDVEWTGPLYDGVNSLRFMSPESPCPYLEGRLARNEVHLPNRLSPEVYERRLGQGFRRSRRMVYRPRCHGCEECRQLRVPVQGFTPTRSMRRVLRRSADVRVDIGAPTPTIEKHSLFIRYLDSQHDGTMSRDYDSFVDFLYDSPIETVEITYRVGGKIAGVSIADRVPLGLSSVYMYFDPDLARRSLGTYSVLWEIDYCGRRRLPYYYLGYFVADCRSMSYKARFRPNEVLDSVDRWVSFRT